MLKILLASNLHSTAQRLVHLCSLLLAVSSFCQAPGGHTVDWTYKDRKDEQLNRLYPCSNGTLVGYTEYSHGLSHFDAQLTAYDAQLTPLAHVTFEKAVMAFLDAAFVNDRYVSYWTRYKKNASGNYAVVMFEHDPTTMAVIGEERELVELVPGERGEAEDVAIYHSPNGKFQVVRVFNVSGVHAWSGGGGTREDIEEQHVDHGDERSLFALFDDHHVLVKQEAFPFKDLPYAKSKELTDQQFMEDVYLMDDGTLYCSIDVFADGYLTLPGQQDPGCSFYVWKPDRPGFSLVWSSDPSWGRCDIKLAIGQPGQLLCSGFFSQPGSTATDGLYMVVYDHATGKITTEARSAVDADLMAEGLDEKDMKKDYARKNCLRVQAIHCLADGFMVLGEQIYRLRYRPHTVEGQYTPKWSTMLRFNDIVAVRLSPNGEVLRVAKTRKRQGDGPGDYWPLSGKIGYRKYNGQRSFRSFQVGEHVYLLWNDGPYFGGGGYDEDRAHEGGSTLSTIMPDGTIKNEKLFDFGHTNQLTVQTSDGALILVGGVNHRSDNYPLARVKIE